jgi:hypothetical protein
VSGTDANEAHVRGKRLEELLREAKILEAEVRAAEGAWRSSDSESESRTQRAHLHAFLSRLRSVLNSRIGERELRSPKGSKKRR